MGSILWIWLAGKFLTVSMLQLTAARTSIAPAANFVEQSEFGLRAQDGCNWVKEFEPGLWTQTLMACKKVGG